ncbi:MAG: hypothetical protein U1E47_02035 [Rivihabitans pingtungensis]
MPLPPSALGAQSVHGRRRGGGQRGDDFPVRSAIKVSNAGAGGGLKIEVSWFNVMRQRGGECGRKTDFTAFA